MSNARDDQRRRVSDHTVSSARVVSRPQRRTACGIRRTRSTPAFQQRSCRPARYRNRGGDGPGRSRGITHSRPSRHRVRRQRRPSTHHICRLTLFTCGLFVFPWIVWANTGPARAEWRSAWTHSATSSKVDGTHSTNDDATGCALPDYVLDQVVGGPFPLRQNVSQLTQQHGLLLPLRHTLSTTATWRE